MPKKPSHDIPALEALSRAVRPPKTAELLAHQLRKDIATGVLREGTMLPPEQTLSAALGVSRQTLREALRILESEHMVSVQRGVNGGARVAAPEPAVAARTIAMIVQHRGAGMADLFGAYEFVEIEAVRRLAADRTQSNVRALKRVLNQHEKALKEDPVMWWGVSSAFHQVIVDCLGNETLSTLHDVLAHVVRRAGHQISLQMNDPTLYRKAEQYQAAHEEITEVIAAGDIEHAAACWQDHLKDTQKLVLRHLGGQIIANLVD